MNPCHFYDTDTTWCVLIKRHTPNFGKDTATSRWYPTENVPPSVRRRIHKLRVVPRVVVSYWTVSTWTTKPKTWWPIPIQ